MLVERAAARNRALLWVLFDTGVTVSELCALRLCDLDRTQGIVTIRGQGSRARRITLGPQSVRHLLCYLDQHRPKQEELLAWGNAGEDHLFLSESRLALTINGIEQVLLRLKKRAGLTGKRISPQVFRQSFAMRYLQAGGSPLRLRELLDSEERAMVKLSRRLHEQWL